LRRQSDEEVALARILDKIFRRSDAIDCEALCVVACERVSHPVHYFHRLPPRLKTSFPISHLKINYQVWHLRIAVHALADAGSLLDCAAAIRHFRRPDVEVLGADYKIQAQMAILSCVQNVCSCVHVLLRKGLSIVSCVSFYCYC
jgi:exosome complex component RRP45